MSIMGATVTFVDPRPELLLPEAETSTVATVLLSTLREAFVRWRLDVRPALSSFYTGASDRVQVSGTSARPSGDPSPRCGLTLSHCQPGNWAPALGRLPEVLRKRVQETSQPDHASTNQNLWENDVSEKSSGGAVGRIA